MIRVNHDVTFLVDLTLRTMNSLVDKSENWVIAFSGGKDSTLLLHLVAEFLKRKNPPIKNIYILYNDTLGELPPIHKWALEVGDKAEKYLKELGYNAKFLITVPEIHETYYWRVIVRGYPAPNYKFRWCIELLKIRPTKKSIRELVEKHGRIVLLTGLRDEESASRSKSMREKTVGCAMSEGPNCLGNFILKTDFENTIKAAPIRYWKEKHVWQFLSKNKPPWGGSYLPLMVMYNAYRLVKIQEKSKCKVRFGCWFCTVSPKHCGLKTIIEIAKELENNANGKLKELQKYFGDPRELELLEQARQYIRKISDIPELRIKKNKGYSKLGPLKPEARAIIMALFYYMGIGLSKETVYGLHKKYNLHNKKKYSIFDIFYKLDSRTSTKIIKEIDKSPRAKQIDLTFLKENNESINLIYREGEYLQTLLKYINTTANIIINKQSAL